VIVGLRHPPLRVVLREEALKHGLTGLVGYAVTNHIFTHEMLAYIVAQRQRLWKPVN
jgi:hypothetical protein